MFYATRVKKQTKNQRIRLSQSISSQSWHNNTYQIKPLRMTFSCALMLISSPTPDDTHPAGTMSGLISRSNHKITLNFFSFPFPTRIECRVLIEPSWIMYVYFGKSGRGAWWEKPWRTRTFRNCLALGGVCSRLLLWFFHRNSMRWNGIHYVILP